MDLLIMMISTPDTTLKFYRWIDPMKKSKDHQKFFENFPVRLFWLFLGLVLVVAHRPAHAQALEPGIWLRLVDSRSLWQQAIKLCEGTPFKSPAMAVAAAKSAGLQPGGGNKTVEAAIAFLNMPILSDLHVLDQFVVSADPHLQTHKIDWRVAVPADDGTADALVTALALEHSAIEPSLGAAKVERLGPNLMVAREAGQVYFGPDRRSLERAFNTHIDQKLAALVPPLKAGLWLRADPHQWPPTMGRTTQERLGLEAIRRFSGGQSVEIRSFPWGESLQTECVDLLRLLPSSPVTPQWQARWEPALNGRIMGQISLGLDPRRPFWNQVFELATDLERSLPGRDRVASLRDRINIAALLARISPETDLYPNLTGLTLGAVVPETSQSLPTIVATLHSRDVRSAQILVEKFVVPLIRTLGEDPKTPKAMQTPPRSDSNIRGLAMVQGRPIFMFLDVPDICLVWGARNVAEAVAARVKSEPLSETASMQWMKQFAQAGPVHRVASVYPEALVKWRVMMGQPASPWTESVKGLPPIVWLGRSSGGASRDIFAFSGLRGLVQSLTARIPVLKDASE